MNVPSATLWVDIVLYNVYVFGLNEGWIVYLAKTNEYALVLAYEGDYSNCIISQLYETEADARWAIKHEADYGLIQDVPEEWCFESGSWSEKYANGLCD